MKKTALFRLLVLCALAVPLHSCIFGDDDDDSAGNDDDSTSDDDDDTVSPDGGGPDGGPPPMADPFEPPTPPAPVTSRRFRGDLGCRVTGRQPKWLEMELPITLEACSRNFMFSGVPYVHWNSRATNGFELHDVGLGPGWSLSLDQMLYVVPHEDGSEEAVIYSGDLTQSRFSHFVDGMVDAWVPEPYLHASLTHDTAAGTWELIDVPSNEHYLFREYGSVAYLVRVTDAHGLRTYYDRAANGLLLYVTDSVLDPRVTRDDPTVTPPPAWWYRLEHMSTGTTRMIVRDASNKVFNYDVDSAGRLEHIRAPGGRTYDFTYMNGLLRTTTSTGMSVTTYSFDAASGMFVSLETELASYRASYAGMTFELEDDQEARWRGTFAPLPEGGLYLSVSGTDHLITIERNAEAYLTNVHNEDDERVAYEPDDGVRSGTTTLVRYPENDGDGDEFTERVTWGNYYEPRTVVRQPGVTTTFYYEGMDNDGEPGAPSRCDGDAYAQPWAFRQMCKKVNEIALAGGDTMTEIESVRFDTTSHSLCGGSAECRVTYRLNNHDPLSATLEVRDGYGRLQGTLDALGHLTRVVERNTRGHVTTSVDQIGVVTTYVRDAMGREDSHSTVSPSDPNASWTWSTVMHAQGFVTERTYSYESDDHTANESMIDSMHTEGGVPQLRTARVTVDGEMLEGTVESEIDEFGRTLEVVTDMPSETGAIADRAFHRSVRRDFTDDGEDEVPE